MLVSQELRNGDEILHHHDVSHTAEAVQHAKAGRLFIYAKHNAHGLYWSVLETFGKVNVRERGTFKHPQGTQVVLSTSGRK